MTTKRKKRDPHTRTVVSLPEQALSEVILHLAAPLLERLGPAPAADEVRGVLAAAIELWNAHVLASPLRGAPQPKPLAALRKAMCGKQAPPGHAETFELLSARWRAELDLDPRLVAAWSYEATAPGQHRLVCEHALPEGVVAHVPPPAEKRIAIGGRFLDEVHIRLTSTSSLAYPVEHHRAEIGADGGVTIYAKMPTALALFAEGRLAPVGGAPVELVVGGQRLEPMVLTAVGCTGTGGHHDIAVLAFRRQATASRQ